MDTKINIELSFWVQIPLCVTILQHFSNFSSLYRRARKINYTEIESTSYRQTYMKSVLTNCWILLTNCKILVNTFCSSFPLINGQMKGWVSVKLSYPIVIYSLYLVGWIYLILIAPKWIAPDLPLLPDPSEAFSGLNLIRIDSSSPEVQHFCSK